MAAPHVMSRRLEEKRATHRLLEDTKDIGQPRLTAVPRVDVWSPRGRRLDTYTGYQEAIYKAKWRVKQSGLTVSPEEWRLPHTPVPARPDYSRTSCSFKISKGPKTSLRHTYPEIPTMDVYRESDMKYRLQHSHTTLPAIRKPAKTTINDVSFVAESLQRLPNIPFIWNLQNSSNSEYGRKTYVQIVSGLLLQKRYLSMTDKREAVYYFPGFCSGCQRQGFCYGCEYRPYCHVHHDWKVKTGGGFSYWKRDKGIKPLPQKHPLSWDTSRFSTDFHSFPNDQRDDVYRELQSAGIHPDEIEDGLFDPEEFARAIHMDTRSNTLETTGESVIDDMGTDADEGIATDSAHAIGGVHPETMDLTLNAPGSREGSEGSMRQEMIVKDGDEDVDKDEYDTEDENGSEDEEGHQKRWEQEEEEGEGDENEEKEIEDQRSEEVEIAGEEVEREKKAEDISQTSDSEEEDAPRDGLGDSDTEMTQERQDRTGAEATSSSLTGSDSRDDTNPGSSSPKKISLYKAPKPFQLRKRTRRVTKSESPFSDNRQLNVPRGPAFQLKKTSKKATEFAEFKRSGGSWEEPKKFELKKEERKATEFWVPPARKQSNTRTSNRAERSSLSRRNRDRGPSPDSGLESEQMSESAVGTNFDSGKEKSLPLETDGSLPDIEKDGSARSRKRSEIVKKTRKTPTPVKTRQKSVTLSMSPPPPTPPSTVDDYEMIRVTSDLSSPVPEVKLPDLELPPLPNMTDDKQPNDKQKTKMKFVVEAPPLMKEAPPPEKKRKPPPKVRKLPKMKYRRHSRPAEAPLTTDELTDLEDPLDYLAKYCIINPNRLPFYEIIFNGVVDDQDPRFEVASKPQEPSETQVNGIVDKDDTAENNNKSMTLTKSTQDVEKAVSMAVINKGLITEEIGLSPLEQYLNKIIFTLDRLSSKHHSLRENLDNLNKQRTAILANQAKKLVPQIASLDYVPKKKKGKKKKKKQKKGEAEENNLIVYTKDSITDDVIVARLSDSELATLAKDPEVRQLDASISRMSEKLESVDNRLQELNNERMEMTEQCINFYLLEQSSTQKPPDFRRQQSALYNTLRPEPDIEMNVDEVEPALQQINNRLLTEKEFQYLYHILNLPGRERINFRLFSVIAALSEKVTQLDPMIRSLINKFDYRALDVKMEKCKELFKLLEDESFCTPRGGASARSLAVELTAGGLTPDHTNYVLNKFNREGKGIIDFLDFVTYVPLFVEIHQRIIQDPLREDLDL